MMKNRAGWLALSVLAIATALMVFFVLPQISGEKKPIGEAINEAGKEVKEAVSKAGTDAEKLAADSKAATEHATRLTAESDAAMTDLKALFAEGKVPTAEALAGAKAKAEATVRQLAELKLPEGADKTVTDTVAKAQVAAKATLGMLQALPADPSAAGTAVAALNQPSPGAGATTTEAPANPAVAGSHVPTFDVLRVERNGSTVIAGGNAEPGARLDIIDGDKVVATAEISASGDFAAVLDTPLPAGDHQLVLKVTGKDGKSTLSEEVATISVPENADGELLAMVSKPGTASRIINAPKAHAPSETSATAAGAANNDANAAAPALPKASPPAAGTAPGTAGKPDVQVSAVEIENDRVFVAGLAAPGSTVHAYADDALIGKATTAADGSFVVDGTLPLAVGDHTIRVDMVDAAGKVTVRASVPFTRPEGDQIAVVAKTPHAGAPATMTPLEDGAFDKLRNEASRAFTILDGLYADGKTPTGEQLAAARSAVKIALKSLASFQLSSDADAKMKEMVQRTGKGAASTLEVLDALPNDAKSVGAGLGKLRAMIDDTLQPALDGQDGTASTAIASGADAPSDQAQPATGAGEQAATDTASAGSASGEPKVIQQAPLTESHNSVIIRRGDTLWQISRRIYGKGVRYTTIYLANKDNIDNPDIIQPGQIFGVPKDALPDSEMIHRERLSGQPAQQP